MKQYAPPDDHDLTPEEQAQHEAIRARARAIGVAHRAAHDESLRTQAHKDRRKAEASEDLARRHPRPRRRNVKPSALAAAAVAQAERATAAMMKAEAGRVGAVYAHVVAEAVADAIRPVLDAQAEETADLLRRITDAKRRTAQNFGEIAALRGGSTTLGKADAAAVAMIPHRMAGGEFRMSPGSDVASWGPSPRLSGQPVTRLRNQPRSDA